MFQLLAPAILVALLAILVFLFFARPGPFIARFFKHVHIRQAIVVFLLLLAFVPVFLLANVSGIKAGRRAWRNSPHIYLTFKTSDTQPSEAALLRANAGGRLSLLGQTKDLVIVFQPNIERDVFVLRRADLVCVHIWP
jgi:hypothetical protein